MTFDLRHGDCVQVMASMEADSVDSIVTDPPYGLGFMGKEWDALPPSVDVFREALRVLKPGGHLLAFGGTRTYHRLAVAVEDAGFEVRDMIAWVYGSGFPKSLNIGKAIDKRGGAVAGFEQFRDDVLNAMKQNGVSRAALQNALGNFMLSHYLTAGSQPAIPNVRDYLIIRDTVSLGDKWDEQFLPEAEREVIGQHGAPAKSIYSQTEKELPERVDITAPATPEAQKWQGWGTALKPAHEPIVLARKPLDGTVAANVLQHGTGGLNIDECRVGTDESMGRWPANLIHDGSDEVVALFPSNVKGQVGMSKTQGGHRFIEGDTESVQKFDYGKTDSGSAARFFYCAKANKKDRNEGMPEGETSTHPTVKPTDLMRYLTRLITPPGGTVLDPFMGSGSTGKAAMLEGFHFVGIELQEEYLRIAEARIKHAEGVARESMAKGEQVELF